jgi:predicted nucleic acid-binding protein
MDDRGTTQQAELAGLLALPTILVLEEAANQELIDLPQVLAQLQQTRFYAAPHLFEDALERDRQPKQSK